MVFFSNKTNISKTINKNKKKTMISEIFIGAVERTEDNPFHLFHVSVYLQSVNI